MKFTIILSEGLKFTLKVRKLILIALSPPKIINNK